MSDAPRVELSNTDLSDLADLSAPADTHSQALPVNGSANQASTQQTASDAKNSILESKVSGTENASAHCREPKLTPCHSITCASHTTLISAPNNHTAAQNTMASIQNHPSVQNAKETVLNGKVSAAHVLSRISGCELTWSRDTDNPNCQLATRN
jgi:hypothetical protein